MNDFGFGFFQSFFPCMRTKVASRKVANIHIA